ncbi:MAG: M20/M25/M40 family metallo-hydrolase [Pseudohongiella sp.]|uniref:M20/M25/M40 family metallo-hydrolase n=1 Tax=Pseudohongiella sp. TaxID=1979412 RepID=UPI0034A0AD3D
MVSRLKLSVALLSLVLMCQVSYAQLDTTVFESATAQKEAMVATMAKLVSIESGSGDREGLEEIAALVASELQALGGEVELLEAGDDVYRMFDTPEQLGPMVHARFMGSGDKNILLIAHMDTVYLRGMIAEQPFRIDGNRAYGLGISDDKQGVALIIHVIAMLQALDFDDYGTLTVLINGDEEISSPGSRAVLTRLGTEHDAVFSVEPTRIDNDSLSLATSGIGAVTMLVKGRASHAGAAPEMGRNALYEMAHQLLQLDDLSDPDVGFKVNWTLAQVGTNRNVIPADAVATADVRMLRLEDFERLESRIEERISNRLIPDTEISLRFENRRPPLQATDASRALAAHGQQIYEELGMTLVVNDQAEGGGTDAAFAALETEAPVIERFGLQGFGAHSNNDEYVLLDSIEPRLYLLARMIMDVSTGAVEVK